MSAYIVEEKCLNDIVNWLAYSTKGRCTRLLRRKDYFLHKHAHCERLYQDMLELNIQSVEIRYPESEGRTMEFFFDNPEQRDFSFKHSDNPGIYQALKAIRCWLYQCMEGEPMESSMLYVTFKRIEDIIMTSLIEQIPEYQEACRY